MIKLIPEEIAVLKKHLQFYKDLDSGKRIASTKEQARFKQVCKKRKAPKTLHECAYHKWKQLQKLPKIINPDKLDPRKVDMIKKKWAAMEGIELEHVEINLKQKEILFVKTPDGEIKIKYKHEARSVNIYDWT